MPPATTSRLQPHAPVAERVLVPGDPGRALRLAQWLLETPKMLNHHRGLWGYTGTALEDSEPLTIQSSGTGGPSAALVIADLATLGARRVVRVGTAAALDRSVALGALIAAEVVVGRDGTSRALGADERQPADPALVGGLVAAGARLGTLLSVDVPAEAGPEATAVDLESAAVLAAAARAGLRAASLVAVTERGDERIDSEGLAAAERELGRIALAALGAAYFF